MQAAGSQGLLRPQSSPVDRGFRGPTRRFDTILKSGIVVNQEGEGVRGIDIIGGRPQSSNTRLVTVAKKTFTGKIARRECGCWAT